MATYRIYFINHKNKICEVVRFESDDEEMARRKAVESADDRRVELWCGLRIVDRFRRRNSQRSKDSIIGQGQRLLELGKEVERCQGDQGAAIVQSGSADFAFTAEVSQGHVDRVTDGAGCGPDPDRVAVGEGKSVGHGSLESFERYQSAFGTAMAISRSPHMLMPWKAFHAAHAKPFVVYAELPGSGSRQAKFGLLRALLNALQLKGACSLLPEKEVIRIVFEREDAALAFANAMQASRSTREGNRAEQWAFIFDEATAAKILALLPPPAKRVVPRGPARRRPAL